MILINGHWEIVKDSHDIIRIIEENMGNDFANKVRKIYGTEEQRAELEDRICELENEIDELSIDSMEYDSTSNELEELNYNLEKLKKYIDEYNVETDFDKVYVSGLEKAYKMIYYGDEL